MNMDYNREQYLITKIKELNDKYPGKNKEYSLGDMMLLVKFEDELKDIFNYSQKMVFDLSPNYYGFTNKN